MKAAAAFGRLLSRPWPTRACSGLRTNAPRTAPTSLRTALRSYSAQAARKAFRPSRSRWKGRTTVLYASASGALGAAAFAELAGKDNTGTEETGEMRMLEASREEIAKKVSDDDRGLSRIRHKIILFLDLYIWEPVCTGVRFLQLVVIFVPVIIAVPAIWVGRRQKDRDNERSGTLWWYGFLVGAMEYAGPAFIKVRCGVNPDQTTWTRQLIFSLITL
jgi:aarF domain-containing kinase